MVNEGSETVKEVKLEVFARATWFSGLLTGLTLSGFALLPLGYMGVRELDYYGSLITGALMSAVGWLACQVFTAVQITGPHSRTFSLKKFTEIWKNKHCSVNPEYQKVFTDPAQIEEYFEQNPKVKMVRVQTRVYTIGDNKTNREEIGREVNRVLMYQVYNSHLGKPGGSRKMICVLCGILGMPVLFDTFDAFHTPSFVFRCAIDTDSKFHSHYSKLSNNMPVVQLDPHPPSSRSFGKVKGISEESAGLV